MQISTQPERLNLDAVEKLTEAVEKASPSTLDEVEQMLARAGRQLVNANEKAHAELERLAQAGEQPGA